MDNTNNNTNVNKKVNNKISNIIYEYSKKLHNISTTPKLDVEVILSHILGYDDRIQIMMNYDKIISDKEYKLFLDLIEKRVKSVPIAYIINKKEFMGYDFYVDENVLIPRPDTEIIVEELLNITTDYLNKSNKINILDMCVGSGAIILSTAKNILESSISDFEKCYFWGVDISENALDIANINKKHLFTNYTQTDNIKLIKSDLFTSKKLDYLKSNIDIIVSNPPYIADEIIATLSPDVKNYEPILALSGGDDGMDFYNRIIEDSINYLKYGGILIFESGHDQAEKISSKMIEFGFEDIYIKKDLQGFDRLVCGKFTK